MCLHLFFPFPFLTKQQLLIQQTEVRGPPLHQPLLRVRSQKAVAQVLKLRRKQRGLLWKGKKYHLSRLSPQKCGRYVISPNTQLIHFLIQKY